MRTSSRDRRQEPPGAGGAGSPVGGASGPARGGADQTREPVGALERRYAPCLDGLFTYTLAATRAHDSAYTVVGEALVLAERQRREGRAPAPELWRAWLYALVRWCCLRHVGDVDWCDAAAPVVSPDRVDGVEADRRRRELAALAWPEAAGTTPRQREALELATRHQLAPAEVARVLRLPVEATRTLLTGAACEVERARGARAALSSGGCSTVVALAGEDELLRTSAVRQRVTRHVDECPVCRPVAQRTLSGAPWPGTAPTGDAELPVLPADRAPTRAAWRAAARARTHPRPRFDRSGFPLDERDRAARRERLRGRVVTATVVVTVLAAPALAMCAALRGGPEGEAGRPLPSIADEEHAPGYEDLREERTSRGGHPSDDPGPVPEHTDGALAAPSPHAGGARERDRSGTGLPAGGGPRDAGDGEAPAPSGSASPEGGGHLAVETTSTPDGTRIVLTATGAEPVAWHAEADRPWLRLSRTAGLLSPGERVALLATVDGTEPRGRWTAYVTVGPQGTVVTVEGGTGPSDEPEEPAGVPGEDRDRGREPEERGRTADGTEDDPPESEAPLPDRRGPDAEGRPRVRGVPAPVSGATTSGAASVRQGPGGGWPGGPAR